MAALGPGVERLAEEAAALWPEARLAILSSDLAESPRALKARIDEIAGGGADIVIGTQIVSKGHNFPHLTLVGVVDADLGLQGADLRAAEKTFQLIRQVAGRAGRAERKGAALIQTHQPEHPAIRAILAGDDEGFWRAEAEARHAGRRAALRPDGRHRRQRHRRASHLGRRPRPRPRRGAAARRRRRALGPGPGADRPHPRPPSGASARPGPEGRAAAGGAARPGPARCRSQAPCGSRSTSIRRASSETADGVLPPLDKPALAAQYDFRMH